MISSTSKKANLDLDTQANNFERAQINALKDGSSKNSERLKINGLNALRFEVTGSTKGVFGKEMVYFVTLIDAGSEVIFINAWSPASVFPEAKPEFINIINSIKGLEGESVVDGIKTTITKQAMPTKASPNPSTLAPITPAPTGSVGTPADKLEALNGMLKKGLITQQDYDAKKAEILKSM
jgi:hypothetical protein